MPTINEMVQEHNALAKKLNKPTLSSWKQDKIKLQERIDRLSCLSGPSMPENKKSATINKPLPKSSNVDKANELLEKEAKRVADNTITVVDVAEELNIDPKVARAKLRRKGMKSNEGRWPRFKRNSDEHKDFIKLLRGSDDAGK